MEGTRFRPSADGGRLWLTLLARRLVLADLLRLQGVLERGRLPVDRLLSPEASIPSSMSSDPSQSGLLFGV